MFTPRPTRAEDKQFGIVRVGSSKPLYFIARCRMPAGVMVHRWNDRTRLCSKDNNCLACEAGVADRWEGWIFGQSVTSSRVVVVHITQFADEQLEETYSRLKYGLYGRVVRLQRKGGRKGKVYAQTLEPKECGAEIEMVALEARIRSIYKSVGNCSTPQLKTV